MTLTAGGNDVQFSANGRYLAATMGTGPAEEAFRKALALDPNFAPAWARLSRW